jgi:hypothetical protein
VVLGCLAVRYAVVGIEAGPVERYQAVVVLWCAALGWAAATADSGARRVTLAALTVVSTVGFFGDGQREAIVIVGILLLLVDRAVPVPRPLAVCVHTVAVASLWIYLTQWQAYPPIEDAGHPYAAIAAAVVVGILAQRTHDRINTRLRRGAAADVRRATHEVAEHRGTGVARAQSARRARG